ncbi:MAG: HAMP domain-containing histidine kinase, partial [Eubacterium sp.]|nr:HAMP domain-containing histidine kinase [Eubacterium sp.]
FQELFRSFNLMVEELGTIETLRDGFVADVSHEFKTPIAAIDGYATLLQDESLSPAERQQHVANILDNCRRLTNLTGNVLMLSKLENGTTFLKKQPFRLDEQIRRIVLSMEEEWTRKEMELDIEMDPVVYIGDEDLLYHVWMNLISNAVKFSNPGGMLQIRLEENAGGTGVVCASIRDSGIGIRADQLDHIYDKFYQADRSRSREGNGLGLALVKRIADECGISISVSSKQGKGTVFILELPTE